MDSESSRFGTPGSKTGHPRTPSKVDQRDTIEVSARWPSPLARQGDAGEGAWAEGERSERGVKGGLILPASRRRGRLTEMGTSKKDVVSDYLLKDNTSIRSKQKATHMLIPLATTAVFLPPLTPALVPIRSPISKPP